MSAHLRRGRFRLSLATIAAAALAAACSGNGATGPDQRYTVGYQNRYYNGMRYGLFVPAGYTPARKYPLILYLHGSTDTTTWDFGWYHDPIQARDPVFVLTPKAGSQSLGWGSSWDSWLPVDMLNTLEILASTRREFSIDSTRLYVTGTSMGGFGTFNLISKRPGLFAGAYAICGGGTTGTAEAMAQTPLWIFHGGADPVVPVRYSRDIYQAIQQAGGTQVRYTEYPGVAHNAWDYTAKEKTLDRWFLMQRKGMVHRAPDSVRTVQAAVSGTQATLTWRAPADTASSLDAPVWFYRVYRDGTLLVEVESPGYVDAALPGGAAHAYAVAAVNYFFKESPRSAPVQATVP